MTNSDQIITNSYLTFHLGKELFAANVSKVLNILEMMPITEVPRAPSYMKGVINLRGNVLPVIDTRTKFNMKPIEIGKETCILVLIVNIDTEEIKIGAIVDSVCEVIEYHDSNLTPPPNIGTRYKSEFIDGMISKDDVFIMVLNIDKVFSISEIIDIKETIVQDENINQESEIQNTNI